MRGITEDERETLRMQKWNRLFQSAHALYLVVWLVQEEELRKNNSQKTGN